MLLIGAVPNKREDAQKWLKHKSKKRTIPNSPGTRRKFDGAILMKFYYPDSSFITYA